ncbi:TetR/AcrR family transcriptional regulator [Saccharothrix obliqua]|uniref:TetR/AcrR family transcriptional regulator n=1 Tax=Saccharothrix obliqua TaxID=2861747 RepID=UPI001C5EBBC2|nr:TetR family transcriptional regulator [Saccharothrix obliqua]MBW4720449.1 TetR family transcriptional regulator [Saccharothrix obliqua]
MTGEEQTRRKRSGRRAGPTSSHDAILEAARAKFAENGFEGATMRAIAAAADVDSALLHHFFLTKDGLFTAAVRDVFAVPDLVATVVAGDPAGAGERLARAFLVHWDDPEVRPRVEALIRSVRSFDGAAGTVRDFLAGDVLGPVVAAFGGGRPDLRASLLGTHLLGVVYMRYVLRSEPLASMEATELAATIGEACQSYLTERF